MIRRHALAVVRVALLAIGAIYAVGGTTSTIVPAASAANGPAGPSSAVGAAGPVQVTVLPTVALVDGQAIAIHAKAPSGTLIYEVAAHLCQHNADVRDTYDFGFEGPYCTAIGIGNGDFEKRVAFGAGTTAADLNTFKAGTGTARWRDEQNTPHTITCGQGKPCDLVVQLQITGATAFYTAPLCYGSGCGPEPTTPAAGTVTSTTTTKPASVGASTSGKGTAGTSIATPSSTTTPTTDTTATSRADQAADQPASVTTGSSPTDSSREVHVYAAGFVGAVGGARVVQILSKVGRRLKSSKVS